MDEFSDPRAIMLAKINSKILFNEVKPSMQCGCVGPQNGQPVCPCQMRHVKIVDGRYVMTQDLGPAPKEPTK